MKFKVTNTTVKPVRKDTTGKDIRTAIEKVGHGVQFRVGADSQTARLVRLQQGQSTLIDSIDHGLLNLQRGGFVRIEQVKDIAAELQAHSLQKTQTASTRKKAASDKRANEQKARAVEMGKDTYDQKGGAEVEDAVNPDGDPNFLAQANKQTKKRKRRGQEVADASSTGPVGN